MIFLDESGKRWKVFKRSAALSVFAVAVPVAALVVGGYMFSPQWSALSFGRRQDPQLAGAQQYIDRGVSGSSYASGTSLSVLPRPSGTSSRLSPTSTPPSVLGATTGVSSTSTQTTSTGGTTTTTSTTLPSPKSSNANGGKSSENLTRHFTQP